MSHPRLLKMPFFFNGNFSLLSRPRSICGDSANSSVFCQVHAASQNGRRIELGLDEEMKHGIDRPFLDRSGRKLLYFSGIENADGKFSPNVDGTNKKERKRPTGSSGDLEFSRPSLGISEFSSVQPIPQSLCLSHCSAAAPYRFGFLFFPVRYPDGPHTRLPFFHRNHPVLQ